MAYVERAGDIRRRNHNAIGPALIGDGRMEQSLLDPAAIPSFFDLFRVVNLIELWL
jgi:hypothetical protein